MMNDNDLSHQISRSIAITTLQILTQIDNTSIRSPSLTQYLPCCSKIIFTLDLCESKTHSNVEQHETQRSHEFEQVLDIGSEFTTNALIVLSGKLDQNNRNMAKSRNK